MDITLIHNPVSGDDAQPDGAELRRMISDAGHTVTYRPCQQLDWAALLDSPGDLVVVAGGDGTVGRVARRLIGANVPLGLLPLGTANNISRTFGLADLPLPEIVTTWSDARPWSIDVGAIDSPWGSRYFIEGAGMGLFVRTMIEIDARDALAHLDSAEERVAHALTLMGQRLRAAPVRRLTLRLDDRDLSGDYIMMEAMNMRFVGPNLYVAPASDATDGLLDVVLVTEAERDSLLHHLGRWRRGDFHPPRLTTHRGRHLRITWRGDALHVDDEAWPPDHHQPADIGQAATIEVKVVPAALKLLVPSP